ncbi:MAG: NINE protein [Spirochaetota bacterium]
MYSLPLAYFLWLISGFGTLGFHRFYLNKIGTGLLWMFTGGLGMVGAIYDFFTLPGQVREANLRKSYRQSLRFEDDYLPPRIPGARRPVARESIEQTILRTAKKNKGIATPSEVALEGNIPIEEARKYLDKLAGDGYAEMRVTKSGIIVYVFRDFTADPSNIDFEDF